VKVFIQPKFTSFTCVGVLSHKKTKSMPRKKHYIIFKSKILETLNHFGSTYLKFQFQTNSTNS